MTSGISLRPERPGDAGAIAALVAEAFGLPDPASGEAALVAALREAGALSLSLVAEGGAGLLLGHVAFSPVRLDGTDGVGRWLGLAPLAVAPAAQRQGVGAALVRGGLAAARVQGGELVVVLGEPAYYRRFGFRPAGLRGLAWEHPAPAEAFMALALGDGPAPASSGVVRFHPAFDRFAG